MANTYPVVRSGWLDSLPHLFISREKITAFILFRQFLAVKIAVPFAFSDGIHWPISIKTVAIFMLLLVAGMRPFYRWGLWPILGLSFYECWRSWPLTINHTGLEFGIILLMCLMPDDQDEGSKISCTDMIKILMLSVWFFSGLHKLLDGYYLNAEFFALEALFNEGRLGHYLSNIIGFKAPFSCCTQGVFAFAPWQGGILFALAWMTISAEILLPLSLIVPRFRSLGVAGLFIFQGVIACFSGEIDFAFTAFATLFLFVPKLARFTYPSLIGLFLVVQPWI